MVKQPPPNLSKRMPTPLSRSSKPRKRDTPIKYPETLLPQQAHCSKRTKASSPRLRPLPRQGMFPPEMEQWHKSTTVESARRTPHRRRKMQRRKVTMRDHPVRQTRSHPHHTHRCTPKALVDGFNPSRPPFILHHSKNQRGRTIQP